MEAAESGKHRSTLLATSQCATRRSQCLPGSYRQTSFGKGQAMLVVTPLFADYWSKKHWYLRSVTSILLDLLEVRPIVKAQTENISLELNVTRDEHKLQVQSDLRSKKCRRTLKTGLIGANPPLAGLALEIAQSASGAFKHITLEPEGIALEWEDKGDYVTVALPEIQGYSVVEIE